MCQNDTPKGSDHNLLGTASGPARHIAVGQWLQHSANEQMAMGSISNFRCQILMVLHDIMQAMHWDLRACYGYPVAFFFFVESHTWGIGLGSKNLVGQWLVGHSDVW